MKCFYPIYRPAGEVLMAFNRHAPLDLPRLLFRGSGQVGLIFDVVGFGVIVPSHLSLLEQPICRPRWYLLPDAVAFALLTPDEEKQILAQWKDDCKRLGSARVIGKRKSGESVRYLEDVLVRLDR